jgi:4-amino-4-deoxychorismate lyase
MMIVDGRIRNAEYHSARMNRARRELFDLRDELDVRDIGGTGNGLHGLVRCRIVYGDTVFSVTNEEYIRQPIRSLHCVRRDDISYEYKYEERSQFAEALRSRHECDEILIVKHGRITDTSFSNVAFFREHIWVTPAEPLLKGTMRASLLDRGMIVEEDIRVSDLQHFSQVMLINALRDFNLRETLEMSAVSTRGVLP